MKSLLLILTITGLVAAQSAPPQKDIPAIAKAANGVIVSIITSDKGGHPAAQGTGFLVSEDGHIVTNYHVIKNASSAIVKLPDGAFYDVDGVVAFDKIRDLAVIKAHGQNFRVVALGDSDRVQVGEEVVAIGSPLSLELTVSSGIVSGIRTIEEKGGKFLQVTAPISPGSSGGPLFNMFGEVVGITTLYLEGGENLNFAIPINDAKRLISADSKVQNFPVETSDPLANLGTPATPKTAPPPSVTAPSSVASPSARNAPVNAQPTIDEQAACRAQANTVLREERQQWASPRDRYLIAFSAVTSRFEASTSTCYARTDFIVSVKNKNGNDGVILTTEVRDAFGGTIYASNLWDNSEGKKFWEVPNLLMCSVKPRGQAEITCKTNDEFMALLDKDFGL